MKISKEIISILLLFLLLQNAILSKEDKFEMIINKILKNQTLEEDDFKNYQSLEDLRIIRNIFFAKHGFIFRTKYLKTFFVKYNWYKPQRENVDSLLLPDDKDNLELVQFFQYELNMKKIINHQDNKNENLSDAEKHFIGIWQISPVMTAGWSNTFSFYGNRKVIKRGNTMDCEKRLLAMIGNWKVLNNQLIIEYTHKANRLGGKFVKASGSCGTERELINGKIILAKLNEKEYAKHKISNIELSDPYGIGYQQYNFSIDAQRYWQKELDPEKY